MAALEQTNIGNAKRLLKELTHFPKEKLDSARNVASESTVVPAGRAMSPSSDTRRINPGLRRKRQAISS